MPNWFVIKMFSIQIKKISNHKSNYISTQIDISIQIDINFFQKVRSIEVWVIIDTHELFQK